MMTLTVYTFMAMVAAWMFVDTSLFGSTDKNDVQPFSIGALTSTITLAFVLLSPAFSKRRYVYALTVTGAWIVAGCSVINARRN